MICELTDPSSTYYDQTMRVLHPRGRASSSEITTRSHSNNHAGVSIYNSWLVKTCAVRHAR